jgi:hypothetical protein
MRVVMPCVLAVGLLTFVLLPGGGGRAQDKVKTDSPPDFPSPKVDKAVPVPGPGDGVPERASVAQLVERLNQIRKQKADLEKLEQDTIAALRERIKEQRQQLQELERQLQGLGVQPVEPPPPVRLQGEKKGG